MEQKKKIAKLQKKISLDKKSGTESLGAWFLGPKAESQHLLEHLVTKALDKTSQGRRNRFPDDPAWANTKWKSYINDSAWIKEKFHEFTEQLEKYCVPFSSYRYQGHMLWDQSLPAMAGYFAAMLYNQNNVAAEASPLTTALEMEVANDLCRMVGFKPSGKIRAWGHITCDGSVANIEALWSGRNTKLYPLAVYLAVMEEADLFPIQKLKVSVTGEKQARSFVDLSWWELMNLKKQEILDLPDAMSALFAELGLSDSSLSLIANYTVQALGMTKFALKIDEVFNSKGEFLTAFSKLKILGPASAHYSLPKATTLMGMGANAFSLIPVQANARMDIKGLRKKLAEHLRNKIPVITVVAVIGSTEESAVDNLTKVLELREEFRKEGMDFFIHADAAWGGYFTSLLHKGQTKKHSSAKAKKGVHPDLHYTYQQVKDQSEGKRKTEHLIFTRLTGLNKHTEKQLKMIRKVDTVTVDPHKSGFAPYPAGSLLYSDHRMPQMIQVTAPVVYHSGDAPTVGVLGLEGSKPGAAAASVYFSHRVIRPDQTGYGKILGRCNFHTKLLFAQMMAMESKHFKIAALTELKEKELKIVRKWSGLSNFKLWDRLHKKPKEFELFRRTGPDLNIISYVINPVINGKLNKDPALCNSFNNYLFKQLSEQLAGDKTPKLMVTSSVFDKDNSEAPILNLYAQLGIQSKQAGDMNFLITTVMNPCLSDAEDGKVNMIPFVGKLLKNAAEDLVKSKKYLTP